MKTTTARWVSEIAGVVARIDRRHAGDSAADRLAARVTAVEIVSESRPAAYPLGWLLTTGRLSSEQESALLTLSPRRFATAALRVAVVATTVNAAAEAWCAVARG